MSDRMDTDKKVFWFFVGVVLLVISGWGFTPVIVHAAYDQFPSSAGEVGDMYGSYGALVSALALVGLIYTIVQQKHQIKMQVNELKQNTNQLKMQANALLQNADQLKMQKEELALQREEMAGQRAELEGQRKVMAAQMLTAKLTTQIQIANDELSKTAHRLVRVERSAKDFERAVSICLSLTEKEIIGSMKRHQKVVDAKRNPIDGITANQMLDLYRELNDRHDMLDALNKQLNDIEIAI